MHQPVRRFLSSVGGPLPILEAAVFFIAAPLLIVPIRYSVVALALLPIAWLVRLIAQQRTLKHTPADWPLLGLLLMISISLYPSVDLGFSRPKLYGLILGTYLFALLVEHLYSHTWRWALSAILVISGVGVAAAGLVGTSWIEGKLGLPSFIYTWLPRIINSVPTSFGTREPGFHPNEVGGTLALLVPFAIGLALFAKPSIGRVAFLAAGLAMIGTLVLTASRSGLIGTSIALVALLIVRWPRLILLIPLLIVGLAGVVWRLGLDEVGEWILAMDTATGASGQGRLEVWNRAYLMTQDYFFTGIGLNTFPIAIDLLYPLLSVETNLLIPHAHNLFLQVAVDLGVPGLLSFLGLLIAAGVGLANAWRDSHGFVRGLVAGLAAGLLGHLVFGVTDAITLGAKPGVFLWAMLGGSVALGIRAGDLDNVRRRSMSQSQAMGADVNEETIAPRSGASIIQWTQWAFFTLACGLGVLMSVTGIKMFP